MLFLLYELPFFIFVYFLLAFTNFMSFFRLFCASCLLVMYFFLCYTTFMIQMSKDLKANANSITRYF